MHVGFESCQKNGRSEQTYSTLQERPFAIFNFSFQLNIASNSGLTSAAGYITYRMR